MAERGLYEYLCGVFVLVSGLGLHRLNTRLSQTLSLFRCDCMILLIQYGKEKDFHSMVVSESSFLLVYKPYVFTTYQNCVGCRGSRHRGASPLASGIRRVGTGNYANSSGLKSCAYSR